MEHVKHRMAEQGYDYPVWIALFCNFALFVGMGASLAQRWPGTAGTWAGLAIMLATEIYFLAVGWIPRWSFGLVYIVGTGLLLTQPETPDFAPFTLILAVAISAATSNLIESLIIWAGAMALVAVPTFQGNLDNGFMYLLGIEFGWSAGFMLLFQQRQLQQERKQQQARAIEVATDERRRIAREVHDVVAHSLSVTMLHVTGARRALEVDRDVDDAVESLREAERLGRQAMSDIRKTVGLLDKSEGVAPPEPGIEDVPTLMKDFERAGFPVRFELDGSTEGVSPATGLGLYRIAQESMTNVAKHAPGAVVDARVQVSEAGVALLVRNTLPNGSHVAPDRDGGTGLAGMRRRTQALGGEFEAGPADEGWVVRAIFPSNADEQALCRLRRWMQ
ncbi:sensor histidine kinase [Smaragdicoccus niigatensis]|uniref:sensor histidine kinase n=1 Tax=Smaragdicoccus niigatensis TaxID=359359 RepID=UPI00039E0F85|nr:histidine kinase [Smaragdicoccus niigatensis]